MYELDQFGTSTRRLCTILYDKYIKADFQNFQNLIETKRKKLLELLQKIEEFFNITLDTWIIDPLYFEFKDNANLVLS